MIGPSTPPSRRAEAELKRLHHGDLDAAVRWAAQILAGEVGPGMRGIRIAGAALRTQDPRLSRRAGAYLAARVRGDGPGRPESGLGPLLRR